MATFKTMATSCCLSKSWKRPQALLQSKEGLLKLEGRRRDILQG